MKFYIPQDTPILDSNIAYNADKDGNLYTTHNVLSPYNKGTQVYYEDMLFTSFTDIYPLAHFIWEDTIFSLRYAFDLHNDEVFATPTAVPIVADVTVVYVRSVNKWYKAKTTATINFMTEDYVSPANFNEITGVVPYRIAYNYPAENTNTLFWRFDGYANRANAFDNGIGTQTEYLEQIYFKLHTENTNYISLFYLDAETVRIKITDGVGGITTDTTINLIDTSHLDNYEKVCTVRWLYKQYATLAYRNMGTQTIEVWVTPSPTAYAKIGAIKAGFIDYLGKTLDGAEVSHKSYNEVSQRTNGTYVFNAENKESNTTAIIRYEMTVETPVFDMMVNKLKSIVDKVVVLIGDNDDSIQYSTTLNYGAVTNTSGVLKTHWEHSSLALTIENFI